MFVEYRIIDTMNGLGISWWPWQAAEIPDNDDAAEIARAINQDNWERVGSADEDEPDAPGEVIRAAAEGDGSQGIAWIDDYGHQGGTSLVIQWRRPRG